MPVRLGVSDAGVIVDDSVHERMAHRGVVSRAAQLVKGRNPVPITLDPADISPATAMRDAVKFLHIDMDQGARMIVLVTADGFAGSLVLVASWIGPSRKSSRRLTVDHARRVLLGLWRGREDRFCIDPPVVPV